MSFSDSPVTAPEPQWYAVKVRSRSEEAIGIALSNKGFEVLNPSYREARTYSDRVCKVSRAIFAGYLFVSFESAQLLTLISTTGVEYVVKRGAGVLPLHAEELRMIRALCDMAPQEKETIQPCEYPQVGQRVRIETGPLASLEGTLINFRSKTRVVLAVESLHSAVSVEVDSSQIYPL